MAFATLDGDIDLRLLTRCMAPEAALKEPDQPWHWDQVSQKIFGRKLPSWNLYKKNIKKVSSEFYMLSLNDFLSTPDDISLRKLEFNKFRKRILVFLGGKIFL